jgi:hypothetical protein
MSDHDPITKPDHYAWHPSGIQPIEISEWCSFNIGTAINYIWRHAHKGQPVQDLRKAAWHLRREAERIAESGSEPRGPHYQDINLTDIEEHFPCYVRRALFSVWQIGRLADNKFNAEMLNSAASWCDLEAARQEGSLA